MPGTSDANNKLLKLPCLAPTGTKIFAPTADQRFLAGSAEFLRTHFPVQVQYRNAGYSSTLAEQAILHRLLEPSPAVVGNRVFVLYGAAGSGKSELIRWLQTQISLQDASRAAVTIRIARTDLDVFHIAQRFQHLYSTQSFQANTLQRWQECRQKPRTLAKILVLTALEQLLGSDDQINALYYQLIDVVQTNLERCFAAMSQPNEDVGHFIELFSREDLVEILRNSVIPVPVEYETLRYHLLKTFRDQLLEGLDLPYTLKQIAQRIQQEQRKRPILFIDDLVQSINLFATDLLDYFITLEEGCWDVVVGITPNSLEATLRGRELLDRIAFLDTIDDRVEKLWLSDEYGLSSSFLNEMNCTEYARLYLNEYKRQNKQPCNEHCPAFHRCHHLEPDQPDDLLAPFNKEVLIRLFRSLPPGKGKVRYYTLYLRDILERATQGEDLLSVVQQYVKSEQAAYHPNRHLSQVHELYGPLLDVETLQEEATDISRLYQFFDVQVSAEDPQQPVVASLYRRRQETQPILDDQSVIDPGKEAIRGWLKGETVNKQQLRNLRRGIVKAIKDGLLLDTLTRLHIAKPACILRWAQTRLDTVPPVQLEGVDDFDGLPVQQKIGHLAYILHDFADAAGLAEQDLRSQFLTNEAFPSILFQGRAYRRRMCDELEKQLGVKVEEFTFSLLIIAMSLGHNPVELPLSIERKIGVEPTILPKYPESVEAERPRLTNAQLGIIRRLFDDCFKLRENVYDGLLLEAIAEGIDQERALELLQRIDAEKLATDFRLNEEPLGVLVGSVQAEIARLLRLKASQQVTSVLISVCSIGLGTDDASRKLATLLRLSEDIGKSVATFVSNCRPFDLHRALILAYLVSAVQYEDSLAKLRDVILELESQQMHLKEPTHLSKIFTSTEAEALVSFTQQGFRISVSQLEASFLTKIARHLPELYRKLELRLQRG
jgi:predicted AAA+ superfamily ATPase